MLRECHQRAWLYFEAFPLSGHAITPLPGVSRHADIFAAFFGRLITEGWPLFFH
jgi:hypothetical protein